MPEKLEEFEFNPADLEKPAETGETEAEHKDGFVSLRQGAGKVPAYASVLLSSLEAVSRFF